MPRTPRFPASCRSARACLPLAVVLVAALAGACQRAPAPSAGSRAGWPSELTFGFAAGSDTDAILEFNKPLAARLEKAIGIPVKIFVATSYTAVVEAMRARRIDGLQTGVFSYLMAVQEAGAEAIAVMIYSETPPPGVPVFDPTLTPYYYSVISVKKGNGIRTLADLKGRTFNFVEPASTSGHLVPKTELIKAGYVPDRDLKTRFAGSHAASLLSLWHGQADAAATAETILRRTATGGQIEYCGFPEEELGRLRSKAEVEAIFAACPDGHIAAIHYSSPIPGTPIAVRKDLPADLKALIKASLLATPQDPEFIAAGRRWYVDPTKDQGLPNLDAFYNPLREMAKLLDLDLRTLQ